MADPAITQTESVESIPPTAPTPLHATQGVHLAAAASPASDGSLHNADDEMDQYMRSSPIPDDFDTAPLNPAEPGTGDASSSTLDDPDDGNIGLSWCSGISRNEQVTILRAANRLRVHPYQRSQIQDFVRVRFVLK